MSSFWQKKCTYAGFNVKVWPLSSTASSCHNHLSLITTRSTRKLPKKPSAVTKSACLSIVILPLVTIRWSSLQKNQSSHLSCTSAASSFRSHLLLNIWSTSPVSSFFQGVVTGGFPSPPTLVLPYLFPLVIIIMEAAAKNLAVSSLWPCCCFKRSFSSMNDMYEISSLIWDKYVGHPLAPPHLLTFYLLLLVSLPKKPIVSSLLHSCSKLNIACHCTASVDDDHQHNDWW